MKYRLAEIRAAKGFSQEKLAEQVGVTRAMISMIEIGNNDPSLKLARKISRVLDTPIDDLFDGLTDEPEVA